MIKCDMCGSNELIEYDEHHECAYCGAKYRKKDGRPQETAAPEPEQETAHSSLNQEPRQTTDAMLTLAAGIYESGDFTTAHLYYDDILHSEPGNPTAMLMKGVCKTMACNLDDFDNTSLLHQASWAIGKIGRLSLGLQEEISWRLSTADHLAQVASHFQKSMASHYKKNQNNATALMLLSVYRQCLQLWQYAVRLLDQPQYLQNQVVVKSCVNLYSVLGLCTNELLKDWTTTEPKPGGSPGETVKRTARLKDSAREEHVKNRIHYTMREMELKKL